MFLKKNRRKKNGREFTHYDTAGNTTLEGVLKKIEDPHGKAERIWVMDRGILTEDVLDKMRPITQHRRPKSNPVVRSESLLSPLRSTSTIRLLQFPNLESK